jgi:hypothetical protein
MGLAERRAIKAFQDGKYPGLKKDIDAAAGFEVAVEVDWESLAKEDYAHMYEEAFPKVYFLPLIDALRDIGSDDLGKQALRANLKKVVLKNTASHYSPQAAISFEGGVLCVDHCPVTNIDDVRERKEYIVRVMEKAL